MKYQCSACSHEGLKLWRCYDNGHGLVLRCAACLDPNVHVDESGRYWNETCGWTDQLGTWFPACPSEKDWFWGYTSVPEGAMKVWKALPTYLTKIGLEEYKAIRANSYDRLAMRHRLTDEAAIYSARICIANTPRPASPPTDTSEACVMWAEELANRLENGHGEAFESGRSFGKSDMNQVVDSAVKYVRDLAALLDEKDAKAKQWGEPLDMTASRATKAIQALLSEKAEHQVAVDIAVAASSKSWNERWKLWNDQQRQELNESISEWNAKVNDLKSQYANLREENKYLRGWKVRAEEAEKKIKDTLNWEESYKVIADHIRNLAAILDGDGGHMQAWETPVQTAKRAEKALYALLASRDKAEDEKQIAIDAYYGATEKAKAGSGTPSCGCVWGGMIPNGPILDTVKNLKPCAGHGVYGDWRASEARKEIFAKIRQAHYKPGQDTCVDKFDRYLHDVVDKVEAEYK